MQIKRFFTNTNFFLEDLHTTPQAQQDSQHEEKKEQPHTEDPTNPTEEVAANPKEDSASKEADEGRIERENKAREIIGKRYCNSNE